MATMQKELDALQRSQNSAMEKVREEMAAAQVRCFEKTVLVHGLTFSHARLPSEAEHRARGHAHTPIPSASPR